MSFGVAVSTIHNFSIPIRVRVTLPPKQPRRARDVNSVFDLRNCKMFAILLQMIRNQKKQPPKEKDHPLGIKRRLTFQTPAFLMTVSFCLSPEVLRLVSEVGSHPQTASQFQNRWTLASRKWLEPELESISTLTAAKLMSSLSDSFHKITRQRLAVKRLNRCGSVVNP